MPSCAKAMPATCVVDTPSAVAHPCWYAEAMAVLIAEACWLVIVNERCIDVDTTGLMMGATRATPAVDEIEVAVLVSVAAKAVPELAAVTAPDNCAAGPAPALLPEQMLPAGHAEHVVRWFVSVPPLVNEPFGHMLQTAAIAAEYLKSEPHARHSCVPPSAAVPAGQGKTALLPEHACPAAHGVQVVRRAASFPVV